MSSSIYPTNLPGLTFSNVRTLMWKTGIQPALSGKESRIAYQQFPQYKFKLAYEFLRDYVTPSELKSLSGFFNAMQGSYDTFLFADPAFHSVVAETFGIVTTGIVDYQLTATYHDAGYPGLPELIQNLNGTPSIYDNGTLITSGYTIGSTGIVHFTSLPTIGHVLTWTGSFYYRCRFENDEMDFTQFLKDIWESKQVDLRAIKL